MIDSGRLPPAVGSLTIGCVEGGLHGGNDGHRDRQIHAGALSVIAAGPRGHFGNQWMLFSFVVRSGRDRSHRNPAYEYDPPAAVLACGDRFLSPVLDRARPWP